MEYTIDFDEADWESLGPDLEYLFLPEPLIIGGASFHVDAWRVSDTDPTKFVSSQATALDLIAQYRGYGNVWETVEILGHRFVVLILPFNC